MFILDKKKKKLQQLTTKFTRCKKSLLYFYKIINILFYDNTTNFYSVAIRGNWPELWRLIPCDSVRIWHPQLKKKIPHIIKLNARCWVKSTVFVLEAETVAVNYIRLQIQWQAHISVSGSRNLKLARM